MTRFSWLHISDLHQGLDAGQSRWPNVKEALFQDLTELKERCGSPWDLVLFTGDLTQSGQEKEFQQLNETLRDLWGHLNTLGSNPILLAVPGNHDLVRLPEKDQKKNAVFKLLRQWHEDPDVSAAFWEDAQSEYRQFIDRAFQNYRAWWESHPFPRIGGSFLSGALPGDFSAVLERGGCRLGIVGLNSAFLHISDGAEGRLVVDRRQFHRACGGDGAALTRQSDACLLLTHHPVDWLHPAIRANELYGEIATSGRFAAHLFGHMHEQKSNSSSLGGADARNEWQGSSLFGIESAGFSWKREHGYSAGELQLLDDRGELRLWPRQARRQQSGDLALVPDLTFKVDHASQAVGPIAFKRHRHLPIRTVSSAVAVISERPSQPPGGPYHPGWYIHRRREERIATDFLSQPGIPIVLWGPERYGKATLLKYLLDAARQVDRSQGANTAEIEIDFDTFDAAALGTLDDLLREIAARMLSRFGCTEDIPDVWRRTGSAISKLSALIETHVLPKVDRRLIMALRRTERILARSYSGDLFGMLRGWVGRADNHYWSRLRLLVTVSSTPLALSGNRYTSPFFNAAMDIRVEDFDPEQTAQVARLYGLPCTAEDLERMRELVGGQPYLVRLIFYKAVEQGHALTTFLRSAELTQLLLDVVAPWFQSLAIEDRAVLSVLPSAAADSRNQSIHERLYQAGLLRRTPDGRYDFRYPIYRQLFEVSPA